MKVHFLAITLLMANASCASTQLTIASLAKQQCTIKDLDPVAAKLATKTSEDIIAQWKEILSKKKLAKDDGAFLTVSPYYVFTHSSRLKEAGRFIIDKTYSDLGNLVRAIVATALYSAFVQLGGSQDITELVTYAMSKQKYKTDDVVVILGRIAREENYANIYVATESYLKIKKLENKKLVIGRENKDMYTNMDVDRWLIAPFSGNSQISQGITLFQGDDRRLVEGQFVVALGNFQGQDRAKQMLKQFRRGNDRRIAESMGIGKPIIRSFDPSVQQFYGSRCEEWDDEEYYFLTFSSLGPQKSQ